MASAEPMMDDVQPSRRRLGAVHPVANQRAKFASGAEWTPSAKPGGSPRFTVETPLIQR